jgi:prophage maintenance system killer protein
MDSYAGSMNNKLWYAYKRVQPYLIQNFVVAEGAHFTLPEVDTVLSGARISGKDDLDMLILSNTINSFRVLNVMLRNNMFDISDKSVFLKLHSAVSQNEALAWGVFRTSEDEYQKLVHSMFDRSKSELEKALKFHIVASKIQFFFDGNKRTSRLMAYGHLLQNGLMPFSLEESVLLDYNMGMLKYYDTDDMSDVYQLLVNQQKIWQDRYNEL